MLELTNLLAGGGSPPQFQDFTISGTFTPSPRLLEKGGTVMVVLFGGGGGGGSGAGHGAVPKVVFTKVTGPVSVVIGAGGLANTTSGAGSPGGTSQFGAITALGAPGNATTSTGGAGAGAVAYGSYGGIGLILPGIGAACGGGTHNATSGAVAEAYGGGYSSAHAPANLGGGGGSSHNVWLNKNGGSGRCFVIWWE